MQFYNGYRKRLETKLKQKNTQIARDEHLLETLPEKERQSIRVTLKAAIAEREEIQQLLDQVYKLLENKP